MADFSCQFELCARKFPNNISILYCDNRCIINKLSYKDLLAESEKISTVLQKHVQNNTCVGITLKPNPVLPAVILGIHKQKCAFLCIDIKASELDIVQLINRVKLKWIINYESNDIINTMLHKNASLVCNISLVDGSCAVELWKVSSIVVENIYKGMSYYIQTSGTTGTNKIVQVHHNCIMSNIESLRKIFKISDEDLIYLGTPLTFDPFVVELMLALTTGACLLIVPDRVKAINKLLLQTLFPESQALHRGVTFMQMPPSLFLCFAENEIRSILCKESNLRILALGGEKFPEQILRYGRCKNLQIFNLYGITEVSCWASLEEVTGGPVSLGEPLHDTVLEIRNSAGETIADGEGELFIGSERRICVINAQPLAECGTAVFRETGDIVRMDPGSKKLFYVGRKNSIVKRFGQRVCLCEVEQLVLDNTDLNSICVWDEHQSQLILFIVIHELNESVGDKIVDRLRVKLLHSLPAKANPDRIELIPSIPLTINGKVDKTCLMRTISTNNKITTNLSPVDIFRSLWCKFFGMSPCELAQRTRCSFSEMGGNSIVAIQLLSEFDAAVTDYRSADLMGLLLDPDKCLVDYCSFVQTNCSLSSVTKSTDFDGGVSKCLKASNNTEVGSLVNSNVQLHIAWRHELGACVDATATHIAHPRLGDLVAVGSHAHIFAILDANSGAVISKTVLSGAIEGAACVTPCNEHVIVGCYDGYVYCLAIESGTVAWKFRTESSVRSTPVLSGNKEHVIVGSYDKTVYCLQLKDGALAWKRVIHESVKSTPLSYQCKCYIATVQGTCLCLDESDGHTLWQRKTNSVVFGAPCLISTENIIIWPDVRGRVQCFSLTDGDKRWTYDSSGLVYSSLCQMAADRLLFGCFDCNVHCLEARAAGCREICTLALAGQTSGTPCVVRLDEEAWCVAAASNSGQVQLFDVHTARLLQTIDLHCAVFSSPVAVRERLYVGGRDNHVYCIEIKRVL